MGIKKVNLGEGKKFAFEKHINEFLIRREDAKLSEVFTVVVPINKTTHDQLHEDMEQIFIVIQGEGVVRTHNENSVEEIKIKKNDILLIQLDTYHQIINTSKNEDLKYICINAFNKEKETEFTSVSHADNVIKGYNMTKNNLNERPVLVVGAAGFIGKELIKTLNNNGKYVWAFDKNEITDEFGRAEKVKINKDEDFERELLKLCKKYDTCPEILIDATGNNSVKKHSFNLTEKEFEQQIKDNLVSVYGHVSTYAKICKNKEFSGKIMLLGSLGAKMSHREMVGYDAAKGGLETMTRSLSLDYAPFNININLIEIGPIEYSPTSNTDGDKTTLLRKLLPVGRYPTLKEVAEFIINFSKDIPIIVTGQNISVDGGLLSQLRPVFIEKLEEPKEYKLED